MADVEIGDVLRIGAVFTYEGAFEIANVWHAKVTAGAPLGFAAASQDVQDYMEEIYDNIKAQITNQQAGDFLTLANVTQDTTFGAFAWNPAWLGGTAAERIASGVALLAWARTLKPRVQIRKYFGVYSESAMDGGEWAAATRVAGVNAMTDHINSFVGGNGLTMLGVAYNRTLGTTTEALSVTTALEPAYQRRRKRGRGS